MSVSELTEQQVNGVRSGLDDHFLPGCRVAVQIMGRDEFVGRHTPNHFHERSRQQIATDKCPT